MPEGAAPTVPTSPLAPTVTAPPPTACTPAPVPPIAAPWTVTAWLRAPAVTPAPRT